MDNTTGITFSQLQQVMVRNRLRICGIVAHGGVWRVQVVHMTDPGRPNIEVDDDTLCGALHSVYRWCELLGS